MMGTDLKYINVFEIFNLLAANLLAFGILAAVASGEATADQTYTFWY